MNVLNLFNEKSKTQEFIATLLELLSSILQASMLRSDVINTVSSPGESARALKDWIGTTNSAIDSSKGYL